MVDKVIGDFSEKTAPIAADTALIADSESANAYKKVRLDNLSVVSALQSLSLQNEVMNFPALCGIDVDLDATSQWWDKISTPTAAVFMTDVAGEAGITESYEYALETTTDASGEGFYQRYTYADQPRIKSGLALSAMAAVWVGTAGRTVTMSLTTSASTEVTATATAQAWTIIKCENLTLDGTYVDLKFTIDGADTFYVVPIGVNIGTKALRLPQRQLRYVRINNQALIVDESGAADPNTWTDADCTSATNAITAKVELWTGMLEASSTYSLSFRTNGITDTSYEGLSIVSSAAQRQYMQFALLVDDGQIFEYILDRTSGSSTIDQCYIVVTGYWEWE